MQELLSDLEPRQEFENIIIFNELDEVNEVIFFNKGSVDIGFEINHFKKFVLRLSKDIIIGAFNVCFNKRTKFIYMAKTYCHGYSIRRSNWKYLIENDEHRTIAGYLKQSVKNYYDKNILNIMKSEKKKAIKKWQSRADYQCMIAVRDNSDFHESSCSSCSEMDEDEIAESILNINAKLD